MDLTPTACEWAGAEPPPDQDGASLVRSLRRGTGDDARYVLSETFMRHPARMVRSGAWKFITYDSQEEHDQLFNMETDPGMYRNLIAEEPETARKLRNRAMESWNPRALREERARRSVHIGILNRWGANSGADEPYRWPVPESSWKLPER
jgi:choline-sulfatase